MLMAMLMSVVLGGQEPDPTPSAELLQSLGMVPIEQEAATGAVVYRAFYRNGYGRDLLGVSFEMRPDAPPMVSVYGFEGKRISAPVSREAWDRVVDESWIVGRELVPLPEDVQTGDEVVYTLCTDGWTTTVELANTYEYGRKRLSEPYRRRQNACDTIGPEPVVRFGFILAGLAVEAFPACAELDLDGYYNNIVRLSDCLYLSGNTLAAASLMNQKGEPPSFSYGHTPTEAEWAEWLSTDNRSRLEWNGQTYQESNTYRFGQAEAPRLSQVMVEFGATLPDLTIYQAEIGARDDEQGWIKGQVAYREEGTSGGERRYMVADYVQQWSRLPGGLWHLDDWTVGPFRELKPDDE